MTPAPPHGCPVVTAGQMRELDRAAIERHGISADDLMEAAGAALVRHTLRAFGRARYLVVCGKGNNGGDGYVAARILVSSGMAASVVAAAPPADPRGPAARAAREAAAANVRIFAADALPQLLEDCDVVIDALLGIGAEGAPTSPIAEMIAQIAASGLPVAAADVPSGLREGSFRHPGDPDAAGTPPPMDGVLRARLTVTFGLAKVALLDYPGCEFTGDLIVDPINFPAGLLVAASSPYRWTAPATLAALLPAIPRNAHKGQRGRVALLAGCAEMPGAAILSARAALRAGAGLVTLLAPDAVRAPCAAALPEVTYAAAQPDPAHLANFHALAAGMGLGTAAAARAALGHLLAHSTAPLLLDADALNLLAASPPLPRFDRPVLLTPHHREAERLLARAIPADLESRAAAASELAARTRAAVLLKGVPTIVAPAGGPGGGEPAHVHLIPGAVPALAAPGSGDVLSGILAALLACGLVPADAACLGAHIHRSAARRARPGTLAHELADRIPQALHPRKPRPRRR